MKKKTRKKKRKCRILKRKEFLFKGVSLTEFIYVMDQMSISPNELILKRMKCIRFQDLLIELSVIEGSFFFFFCN